MKTLVLPFVFAAGVAGCAGMSPEEKAAVVDTAFKITVDVLKIIDALEKD